MWNVCQQQEYLFTAKDVQQVQAVSNLHFSKSKGLCNWRFAAKTQNSFFMTLTCALKKSLINLRGKY